MKNSTGGMINEPGADGCFGHSDELCESTRLALADERELTDTQKAHLKTCDFCRNFQNETEIMKQALKELDVEPLVKGGVGLADSVMDEIGKQAIFGRTPSVKPKIFRHAGLAAACLMVLVLAAPTALNFMHAGKADITPNETALMPKASFFAGNASDSKVVADEDENAGDDAFLTDKTAESGNTEDSDSSCTADISDFETNSAADSIGENKNVLYFANAGSSEHAKFENSAEPSDSAPADIQPSDASVNSDVLSGSGGLFSLRTSGGGSSASSRTDALSNMADSVSETADGANDANSKMPAGNADSTIDESASNALAPSNDAQISNGENGFDDSDRDASSVYEAENGDANNALPENSAAENGNVNSVVRDENDWQSNGIPVLSFVKTACDAANARFGSRYTVDVNKATYSRLSENSLYVDIPLDQSDAHIQVFMVLENSEWKIATDADGNKQIFEVTARYNFIG